MLFNSFSYIILFLPLAVIVYFQLNRLQLFASAKFWLLLLSLFFYGIGSILYLPLLLVSITFNYFLSIFLLKRFRPQESDKIPYKFLLVTGIAINVLFLGFFKYSDFFLLNFNYLAGSQVPLLKLFLPLAISFYTFQQIAYLVDCYSGEVKGNGFMDYCLFVTFFPQLIAGPIVRHNEFIPQLNMSEQRLVNYSNMSKGLYIFFLGLCKRVVIADTFGIWSDLGFGGGNALSFLESWVTSISYTMQLYFDFSGYIDMAVGSALFFNITLPVNFNSPYMAVNIQDFWKRWHITLSRFLKDYIYIPLGGNRKGNVRMYLNIIVTFLIGGFWHGAEWTFVIWGILHGTAALIHRWWNLTNIRLPRLLAIFITFNFINITWVFFRAPTVSDAVEIIKSMFGLTAANGLSVFDSIGGLDKGLSFLIILLSFIIVFLMNNTNAIARKFEPTVKAFTILVFIIVIGACFLNSTVPKGFLYFDF